MCFKHFFLKIQYLMILIIYFLYFKCIFIFKINKNCLIYCVKMNLILKLKQYSFIYNINLLFFFRI